MGKERRQVLLAPGAGNRNSDRQADQWIKKL